jgi:hypothetical protein
MQTTFKAKIPRSLDAVDVFMRIEIATNLPTNQPTLAQIATATQAAVDAFQKTMRTGR